MRVLVAVLVFAFALAPLPAGAAVFSFDFSQPGAGLPEIPGSVELVSNPAYS